MMVSRTIDREGKPFQRYSFLLHTTKGELGIQPMVPLGNILMRLQGVGSREFQMGVGDMKMKAVFGNACSQLRVCKKRMRCLLIVYDRSLQMFSIKVQEVNILGFAGYKVSVLITKLCIAKASIDNM